MAYLKKISLEGVTNNVAMTEVEIKQDSADVLSVESSNTGLDDDANPLYKIAIAVDGKTITKTGNDGLATTLKLKYHEAVTTEGSEKGAYIALEDINGTSITNSEVMVEDIVGNSVLKSASYSETTGKLTLVFATSSGTDTTVEIDLGKLLDIDDIIIDQETGKDYLSFDVANEATEEGQATLGVKLAEVTYTASTQSAPANLTADVTKGKMVDASEAVPAIKNYVDDVVSKETTARENKDIELTGAINTEKTSREAKDTELQSAINGVSQALGAETTARKSVDGQDGDTYSPNTTTEYIKEATSLNDADIKLDNAIKTLDGKVIENERVTSEALTDLDSRKANASDVLNGVKAGNGIEVDTKDAEGKQTVSVKRDATSESYLTVGTDGVKLSGVGTAISDAIGALNANITKSDGFVSVTIDEANGKITDTSSVSVTYGNYDETQTDGIAKTTNTKTYVDNKIDALNVTDAAVEGQYVSGVSESGGKITVTRANVGDAKLSGFATDATKTGAIEATDTISDALNKIQNTIEENERVSAEAFVDLQEKLTNLLTEFEDLKTRVQALENK